MLSTQGPALAPPTCRSGIGCWLYQHSILGHQARHSVLKRTSWTWLAIKKIFPLRHLHMMQRIIRGASRLPPKHPGRVAGRGFTPSPRSTIRSRERETPVPQAGDSHPSRTECCWMSWSAVWLLTKQDEYGRAYTDAAPPDKNHRK